MNMTVIESNEEFNRLQNDLVDYLIHLPLTMAQGLRLSGLISKLVRESYNLGIIESRKEDRNESF